MPFANRIEAGRRLAQALIRYARGRVVVLALPRGGVPVAAEVASALQAPLDLVLVRKIGYPRQPELAMGAVVDGADPIIVRNEDVIRITGVSEAEFDEVCKQELAEIERRRSRYLGSRAPIELLGRTAIVIDDGLATGATMRAALRALRKRSPAKIVLAVPVAPSETIDAMRGEADEIVCLEAFDFFGAIGAYYSDFRQVSDDELIDALARHGEPAATPAEKREG
ncbi:MAG: phosphoribosyltransferase [Hyphomicrobiales bacterium]|nr:phosphoribosyltransferase [Hyphomicrobiales bacterium]MBV9430295.1 phosphoribosyltransferase [Hyphomicrobiales bacterium]MBV9741261.1 phosphoribosyltransferase [Hyphomicrobiales bacterium]